MSRSEISRITGIPKGTVCKDLWIQGKRIADQNDPDNQNGIKTESSKSLDWDKNLDTVGRVALSIFQQTITGSVKCDTCGNKVRVAKDTPEGRQWLNTFATLYRSKMGGITFKLKDMRTINITEIRNNPQYITIRTEDAKNIAKKILSIVGNHVSKIQMQQIEYDINNMEES